MAVHLGLSSIIGTLNRLRKGEEKAPILKSVHWAAIKSFEKLGFTWERGHERATSDRGLGFWRMPLRPAKDPANKKRIVLIPGFGDSPLTWLSVLGAMTPAMRRNYDELILMDFPGWNGFLSDEPCFAKMDDAILYTGDMLDSLEPEMIIAHSLGGWFATEYAIQLGTGERPKSAQIKNRLKGLVLVAPAGMYGNETELREWKDNFENAIVHGFGTYRSKLFYKEPFWFGMISPEFNEAMKRKDVAQFLRSVRKRHYLKSRAKQVRVPAWVVWGADDHLSPTAWAQTWVKVLKENSPMVKRVLIAATGHSVQSERPFALAHELSKMIVESAKESALNEQNAG